MAKGRELKGRIKSVQNTRKITRTLEMVATSKLKRTQDRVAAARPYSDALREVLGSLYSPDLAEKFPLLRQPAEVKRAAVILMTANRGLSGAFNANLIKEGRATIAKLEGEGVAVDIHAIGKKGLGYFRYLGRSVVSNRTDIGDKPTAEQAAEIVNDLVTAFSKGEIDAVYVVFPQFKSVLSAPPVTLQVLPVQPPEKGAKQLDYLLTPDAETILGALLPLYVRNMIYRALVELTAAFYASQRTAMKNATDNASDILKILGRTYNRARQAKITQEIAEIVGGAAALQG
jgi:F-type H+-transporting ATPase subunit gamma